MRKGTIKNTTSKYNSSSTTWKDKNNKEEASTSKGDKGKATTLVSKGKPKLSSPISSKKPSSITCFKCQGKGQIASQCPNKGTMVLKGGVVVTRSEHESNDGLHLISSNGESTKLIRLPIVTC